MGELYNLRSPGVPILIVHCEGKDNLTKGEPPWMTGPVGGSLRLSLARSLCRPLSLSLSLSLKYPTGSVTPAFWDRLIELWLTGQIGWSEMTGRTAGHVPERSQTF